MANVSVAAEGEGYRVIVSEAGTSTSHLVTVAPADVGRVGPGASAEEVVAASFRFLLDREPKESILTKFDLAVIGRYFPEYPDRIGDYL